MLWLLVVVVLLYRYNDRPAKYEVRSGTERRTAIRIRQHAATHHSVCHARVHRESYDI